MKTPIEVIADAMKQRNDTRAGNLVDTVLVPEQCMIVYINGKPYHVTIEPMPEESDGYEFDSVHGRGKNV